MNGDDFISLAGMLASGTAAYPEARHRTAISRAYYGAFHLAVDALAALGCTIRENHQGHREAITKLRTSGVAEAIRAARLIEELQSMRIRADYRLDYHDAEDKQAALIIVESAHDAVAALEACLNEPIRSQLIAHFTDGAAGSGP